MSLVINHNLMAMNASRNLNSHYGELSTSTRRLSSGLRVGTAADDAAGLATRELMRAEVTTLNQGMRNANDAISMIQVADGALQVIDEKLIRLRELAEQAATGTYNSDQRILIDSEFQAMQSEIQRIAQATDFNGVKLLDGSLSGVHDGRGFQSTGAAKIHFGTGNESAEDYYYINIASADLVGLGLSTLIEPEPIVVETDIPLLSERLVNGAAFVAFPSGLVSFARIPTGSTDISIQLFDNGADDTIQIFTASGSHLVGTEISGGDWASAGVNSVADVNNSVLTEANAFEPGASYSSGSLNGTGGNLPFTDSAPYNQFSVGGMNFGYSGSGNPANLNEYVTIDEAREDLVVMSIGAGVFDIRASWGNIPDGSVTVPTGNETIPTEIRTQEQAQEALEVIDRAIVRKDSIRANLGALQNRLENTVTNLAIQGENLQAAESRISDVDVSSEMTEFVSYQILTQSAVAMLAQANSLPRMALQLISG